MRALIVCPEAPYPLRGGGPMRTAAMLAYLARRYETDAIFFREPGAPDPRAALPAGLIDESVLIELPRHSKSPFARISRNAIRAARRVPPLEDRFAGFEREVAAFASRRRYDLCMLEHFWTASYADTLRPHARRLMLDLHNVESELHQRWSRTTHWPISALHRRFARAAADLERELLPKFDMILAPAAAGNARVYPNTIPLRDPGNPPKQHRLVFSANFDYQPNREGVDWFARHVWPKLSRRYPGLTWLLAGRNPPPIGKLQRVEATGEVDDTLPYLAASRVAIVPILSGSGTRVKILEAWMAGVPAVSTTIGAEGLPARDRQHLLIADDPASFERAIATILDDSGLADHLATEGRRIFLEYFTWEAGWKILESSGV